MTDMPKGSDGMLTDEQRVRIQRLRDYDQAVTLEEERRTADQPSVGGETDASSSS